MIIYFIFSNSVIILFHRSSEEAFITSKVVNVQEGLLRYNGKFCMHKYLTDVEMPVQLLLLRMEYHGLCVNYQSAELLHLEISGFVKKLEVEIFKLHGNKFNINSATQLAKALGINLKQDETRSLTKEVLETIKTPLSKLIILYRKLNAIITKTIHPIMVNITNNRVFGKNISLTTTGRISMHEPSLQNIARDFQVEFEGINSITISCRRLFEASSGKELISADFCQLELRILTHLSRDKNLLRIMKSADDVFKLVSAEWNSVQIEDVTEEMRHHTKQICYAIIYGMGRKSLAHTLEADEDTVTKFVEKFHNAFPALRKYTESVIMVTRKTGYAETMTGRRRYFPNIINENSSLRGFLINNLRYLRVF